MDNIYIARFSMVSELSEADFFELHKKEFSYRNCDNWFSISQKYLWDKFPNGLWGKDVKQSVKKTRLDNFEKQVIIAMKNAGVFSQYNNLYKDETYSFLFNREYNGCDWRMSDVQKVDNIVRDKNITIERGLRPAKELVGVD